MFLAVNNHFFPFFREDLLYIKCQMRLNQKTSQCHCFLCVFDYYIQITCVFFTSSINRHMIIPRTRYVERLKKAIMNPKVKCIVLDGARHAGKTTLLQHIYHDDTIAGKKYYFAFDDHISTKQFKDSQEFISFMQIRFGIDFSAPNLLFLNEIQYSKNIGSIIHDLINVHKIRTKIVATGITQ